MVKKRLTDEGINLVNYYTNVYNNVVAMRVPLE